MKFGDVYTKLYKKNLADQSLTDTKFNILKEVEKAKPNNKNQEKVINKILTNLDFETEQTEVKLDFPKDNEIEEEITFEINKKLGVVLENKNNDIKIEKKEDKIEVVKKDDIVVINSPIVVNSSITINDPVPAVVAPVVIKKELPVRRAKPEIKEPNKEDIFFMKKRRIINEEFFPDITEIATVNFNENVKFIEEKLAYIKETNPEKFDKYNEIAVVLFDIIKIERRLTVKFYLGKMFREYFAMMKF